jgi:hypothetical protein
MTVKDLLRPLPGVRHLSLLRQRLIFADSVSYWERNYERGGTSGCGSYGAHADAKAEFLNGFVSENDLQSVIEFGCGDGNQLSLAKYPCYIGLDVSRNAIDMCMQQFADDSTKSFFLYNSAFFVDRASLFSADLAISLDVIYHLIEDSIYERYMAHLFAAGRKYVVVYATNSEIHGTAPHVRHRCFTSWVRDNCRYWQLIHTADGPGSGPARADFFVYGRLDSATERPL